MKTKGILIAAMTILSGVLNAQTMIIDYEEHTKENTAEIHLIESEVPIDSERFTDITTAKAKLVKTIENYRIDGFEVMTSTVSTHKAGRGLHYHYQYVLQQEQDNYQDSDTGNQEDDGEMRQERRQKRMQMKQGQEQVKPIRMKPGKVELEKQKFDK